MEKLWSSYGTIFAFLAFIQTFINTFLPSEIQRWLKRVSRRVFGVFSNQIELKIEEYDGASINELFSAAQLHLSDATATAARKVNLALRKNASEPMYSLAENESVTDRFQGIKIKWEFVSSAERREQRLSFWQQMPGEKRSLHMQIHKKHRNTIVGPYVRHILDRAKSLKLKNRDRLLYTNTNSGSGDFYSRGKMWHSVPFKHPSTFETLALDPATKKKVVDDLSDFKNAKEFYEKAGRAWKRGYLLYGPPGTGKSSMIAAMANLLEYDVYDLELTEVKSNAMLRKLLIQTSNKSILVIEDIDCSLGLSNRKKKPSKEEDQGPTKSEEETSQVTLSGFLNFTDGLWSCCGSERIIVFTTNHIEKIDPALLRSGRMDMHIHLSYCTFEAFRVLARNYLEIEEHQLMGEVEEAMEGAEMTPADASEVLTREKRDKAEALRCLIRELRERKAKAAAAAERGEAAGGAGGKQEATEEEEEEKEKRAVESEHGGGGEAADKSEVVPPGVLVASEKPGEEEEEKRAVESEHGGGGEAADKSEVVPPRVLVASEKPRGSDVNNKAAGKTDLGASAAEEKKEERKAAKEAADACN